MNRPRQEDRCWGEPGNEVIGKLKNVSNDYNKTATPLLVFRFIVVTGARYDALTRVVCP